VTYRLKVLGVGGDVMLGMVSITVKYPELVVTDINDPVNGAEPFFSTATARRLQQNGSSTESRAGYSTLKTIDSTQSSITITRYTPI
jgi:hypothetical protein